MEYGSFKFNHYTIQNDESLTLVINDSDYKFAFVRPFIHFFGAMLNGNPLLMNLTIWIVYIENIWFEVNAFEAITINGNNR